MTTLPWQPTPLLLTLAAATELYTRNIVTIPSLGKEIRQVFYEEDIPPRTLVVGHNPNGIVFTKSELMCLRVLGAAGGDVFVLVGIHTFLVKCSFRFRN